MTTKDITIDGEGLVLSSEQEYEKYVNDESVKFLRDSNGRRIYGFESLVDGGTYTAVQAAPAPVSLNL